MVLLGKSGDGKSSAGNTILKQRVFQSRASPESVTWACVSGQRTVDGQRITVIDTPGLFDTARDEDTIRSEILRSVIESAPGPDVFILVLKVGRYTEQESRVVEKITQLCGEHALRHALVLFTHGEQLEGQSIQEFVGRSPALQQLVSRCGGRCHVIDSRYWGGRRVGDRSNRVQVKRLLQTVREKMALGGYTNPLLQAVEAEIGAELRSVTEERLSRDQRRELAKSAVHRKLLVRLAGVSAGTLTGAFLGIGVAVASVASLVTALDVPQALKAGTVAAAAVGATGVAGALAVEAGLVTGAGVGAASSGVAAGVLLGAAALAGAIGGGVAGYKAADGEDSLGGAVVNAAKNNYENARHAVKVAQQHQHKLLQLIPASRGRSHSPTA